MDTGPIDPLIGLLQAARAGREGAQDRLVRALYDELRRVAAGRMRHERPDHTLQPSALVHEALLRLLRGDALADLADRGHLLATAARAMRQVLVDHARRRRARPEGRLARRPLDEALAYFEEQRLDVVALHEALDRLAREHPRPARVVDLRFFGGQSIAEVSEVLGTSDTTVESDWRFARAWLRDQLGGAGDDT
jgi:RNA polymerase sigma factor (TIGR02999 family)